MSLSSINLVSPNHSFERTSSGKLRLPAAAAHVELQGLPLEVKR